MKSHSVDMPETRYRSSRLCRVLGNPTAYEIVCTLAEGDMTPSQLSEHLGIRPANVSRTLRHLREVDLVRYETEGLNKTYRLKDPGLPCALAELESLVNRMRSLQRGGLEPRDC